MPIAQGRWTFFLFSFSFLSCIDTYRRTAQRPDIYPPVFHIERSDPKKLAPGYIFITPYEAQNPGPYIFDNSGV